ncbi:MAG TPA: M56 family metallopeptidase, partial [Gemmatimonadaceae bacterium]|nr:M56 family metallopeptidase [Gemmatimonadaceae bacterium]
MTPFILALLAKLTLVLTLGFLVVATSRGSSPSLRHLILFATIAICVVLPFAMWMSPQWNVQVLPRQSNPFADARLSNGITNAPASDAQTAKVIDASNAQSPSGRPRLLATLPLLPFLWSVGFIAVMGWLAIGRFRLRSIAATSWPLDSSAWNTILDDERRDAGVDKSVMLSCSSVVSTPLTWGWQAPVILLPEDALDWPEAHRRIVLRHELAHVARGDSFSQLVAGFVCALYWFHPMAWIAERRLRSECERACDDKVVSLGTPAAEYAAHLLEVARSARAFGAPGFLSVAMARPSQLEGRLLAVLNQSRRRVAVSRGARPIAVVLSALVLIPLAAFRAVPKVEEAGLTLARTAADTTFQLSAPVRVGGILTLDFATGGRVIITGWDKPQVFVQASLGGRDWRATKVTLAPSDAGARLESAYTGRS